MCHTVALPFRLKSILRQKKNNYGNSNISPCKNIILKKSSRRNQNPSRCYNSITNLKFPTQAKNITFQKSSYEDRPIRYLGAKIHYATILYNESKHNILGLVVGKADKLGVSLFPSCGIKRTNVVSVAASSSLLKSGGIHKHPCDWDLLAFCRCTLPILYSFHVAVSFMGT